MTRVFCLLLCLWVAGCAVSTPLGSIAVPLPGGYAAPPPPAYAEPVQEYEQGYGYVIIDPQPQYCCGYGWYLWHYQGRDGHWHRAWRRH